MTYTYTKPLDPSAALQKRLHAARQQAANIAAQIELKRIEEANAEAEATLAAVAERNLRTLADIKRRRDEAANYPVHPEWRRHRAEVELEVKAWEEARAGKAAQKRTKVLTAALQGVAGVVAHPDQTGAAERHTAPRRLRAVS